MPRFNRLRRDETKTGDQEMRHHILHCFVFAVCACNTNHEHTSTDHEHGDYEVSISDLTSQNTALEERVLELEASISDLETQIMINQADISGNQSEFIAISERLSVVEEDVGSSLQFKQIAAYVVEDSYEYDFADDFGTMVNFNQSFGKQFLLIAHMHGNEDDGIIGMWSVHIYGESGLNTTTLHRTLTGRTDDGLSISRTGVDELTFSTGGYGSVKTMYMAQLPERI